MATMDGPLHTMAGREPDLDTPEEREKYYQELVKARAVERKRAIAEGKMDDPLVPKRLEDAITIVGTCMDMCPRFERYRRERENNLFEWESIPGTKRVDHNRAVKMYERAAGDKTLPSDLRPPHVLKRTLDYLFHDLLPRGGLVQTCNFIRDRSRAVRNDFTMQHITGPLAIECHDRCARFHILTLHMVRDLEQNQVGFIQMEEQQLMNTLQSLKEFYEDQRGRYESPTELEMRVYHRLIHIRDQKERHEDIPNHITAHPVFKLTTDFRRHVQQKSAPISKTSPLVVDAEAMAIFGRLAAVLAEQGSVVMIYLVACILERLFGKETVEDIEAIRGELTISDIIDGISTDAKAEDREMDEMEDDEWLEDVTEPQLVSHPAPLKPSSNGWLSSSFTPQPLQSTAPPTAPPVATSAFAGLVSTPNVFGTPSIFGGSVFSNLNQPQTTSVFNTQPQAGFGGLAVSNSTSRAPTPVLSSSNQSSTTSLTDTQSQVGLVALTSIPKVPSPPVVNSNPSLFSNEPPQSPPPAPTIQQQPLTNGEKSTPAFAAFSNLNQPQTTSVFNTQPQASFGGLAVSDSISRVPTPVLSSSNQLSTTSVTDNRSQVGLAASTSISKVPTPVLFSSNQPLTTSVIDTHSVTDTQSQVGPAASTSISKVPTPILFSSNQPSTTFVTDTQSQVDLAASTSISKVPTSVLFGSNQPSTTSVTDTQSQVGLAASTSISKVPTSVLFGSDQPSTTSVTDTQSQVDLAASISISEVPSPPVVDSKPTPFSNGLPQSSPPAPTTQQQLLTNGKKRISTTTFAVFSDLNQPMTSSVFHTQPQAGFGGSAVSDSISRVPTPVLSSSNQPSTSSVTDESQISLAASTPISKVPSPPEVDSNPTPFSNGSTQSSPPAPTTQQQPLTNGKKRISTTAFASGEDNNPPTQRKRARRRISSQYHPPRTDEELAKRFKENHEEHELRWAQGSFLQVIRKHVKMRRPATLKLPWQIWLSMNPESDATAIWLDRKFDIPASGSWVSDSIFAIPLSSEASSGSILSSSPGVIVFECTPLGDVADNLEKKYRILDDCSRLRDIIKGLPVKRRYIPSLLIISWTEGEESRASSDFFDMVKKLVTDSVLQSYHVFAMTSATKDLDNILNGALQSLDLDLEGKLVQTLSLRGVFKLFEPALNTFLNEWIENCTTNRDFNWRLYAQVVQACVTLFNTMSLLVQSLLEVQGEQDPLPAFDYPQLEDSESTFDNVNEWLSHWISRDNARMVAMDLQSHRNIGQDFPSRIFIEHLFEITQTRFQRLHSKVSTNTQLVVPTSSITSSVDSFKTAMRHQHMKLLQTLNFSVRRSPKRRLDSVAPSEQGSPGAKRPRFAPPSITSTNDEYSVPSTPMVNGRESLSPTNSMLSLGTMEEQPTITVAMLRALTRDMKRKYVRS